MAEAENHALPGAANDSWRTWLMTGSRRAPVDKRRLRGAHRGLKKMLIEGMTNGGDKPHAWKEFSGAMIRHAVDDAMRELPVEEKQMVKLAYFGGLSNREIAENIGMTEATVQRRLRRAIDAISEYIERGRSFGRRAFYALTLWLCGRWIGDAAHQAVQAAAVVTAGVIIVVQPSVPLKPVAPVTKPTPVHAAAAPAAPAANDPLAPPKPTPSSEHVKTLQQTVPARTLVQIPKVDLPITLPSAIGQVGGNARIPGS
jgi:RNA polymerase sigma factor (sigma-70 family)